MQPGPRSRLFYLLGLYLHLVRNQGKTVALTALCQREFGRATFANHLTVVLDMLQIGEVRLSQHYFAPSASDPSREILAEIPIGAPALIEPAPPDLYPPPPQAIRDTLDEWVVSEECSWYFLLSEMALRRITDQVSEVVANYIDSNVHYHQSSSIGELVPIVAEFERQAETFRDFLPPALKFPDVPELASTEWQQYSRGRYYRVLELMHRPFLFAAIHEPSCSPTIRALAEKGLVNALRYLQHSHISHRHHGTWLHLRNELKEASLLLAASRSSTLKMPEGWDPAISKSLATFNYWTWEFPSCKKYADVILVLSKSPFANADGEPPICHTGMQKADGIYVG